MYKGYKYKGEVLLKLIIKKMYTKIIKYKEDILLILIIKNMYI